MHVTDLTEIEAQDRFVADYDRLQLAAREFVCPSCRLVAPLVSLARGLCGDCRETGSAR